MLQEISTNWRWRVLLAAGILVGGLSLAVGQDIDLPPREPTTPVEFWDAISTELDLGRFEHAAKFLGALVGKKFADKELLTIPDKYGLTAVLTLRNVPVWSKDPKVNDQAKKNATELIRMISEANRRRLGDPERMRELVALLRGRPEERIYAERQIRETGAVAVPFLV